jgi:tetratricopeptide (TPR) repeat protein
MGLRPVMARGIAVVALFITATATAQSGRLLEASAVTERDDHMDLAIEFSCPLAYRSHAPAAEGDSVRIRLAPSRDCGLAAGAQFPAEHMLPADGRGLVRGIELQPGIAGDAELVVSWNRVEKFVLTPVSGMRGVRIRVQRRAATRVIVGDTAAATADYAVNLASSQQPFDDVAIGSASALLHAPAYVSQVEVEGLRWYRLRTGPFATRREADEILRLALARYPTAWLGVGDEAQAAPEDQATRIEPARGPQQPETRLDPLLDQQLEAARRAMAARQFDEAIRILMQVVASQDYARRRDAAELLGLAHERRGQLAQAKAACEDYLRRYPDSPAAGRVRERLRALRLADVPGRAGTRGGQGRQGWSTWGNVAQVYRRDDTQLDAAGLSRNVVTQDAVLTDADGLVRHRGQRFDFTARTSIGYMKDLQPAGRENRLRVSSAYAEIGDRSLALNARLGRQSRGMAGVNGLFDGLLGSWQPRPRLGGNLVMGAPVESTRQAPDMDRLFLGGALDLVSRNQQWELSPFVLAQQFDGRTDRRSLGFEARYLTPGRTLVTMADYDVHFGAFNGAAMLGTFISDSRWTFSMDASLQRSPQLSIRNALIGQPTLAFGDLADRFTTDEIEQLAMDRSAQVVQFSATASHPLGDSAQWTINLSSFDLAGMPASGDVAAIPAAGRDDAINAELLFNGLLRAGDTHSFALRAQRGGSGSMVSAGIGSRLPLFGGWRLTTRLRADRRRVDDAPAWIMAPSLRLELRHSRATFELEAGAEFSRQHGANGNDRALRRYLSAGYRIQLDRQP